MKRTIEEALAALSAEDREVFENALRIPDLYPPRSIQAAFAEHGSQVRVPDIHAWRKSRGLKKARC